MLNEVKHLARLFENQYISKIFSPADEILRFTQDDVYTGYAELKSD
jgi:hypothetical protein